MYIGKCFLKLQQLKGYTFIDSYLKLTKSIFTIVQKKKFWLLKKFEGKNPRARCYWQRPWQQVLTNYFCTIIGCIISDFQ